MSALNTNLANLSKGSFAKRAGDPPLGTPLYYPNVMFSYYIFNLGCRTHFQRTVSRPTLSFSSGTCLVSLGFGWGDPVFILNSGGTFVSSTTWMGTDSAGYRQENVIEGSQDFFCTSFI